jgi:HSP20 family protein
MVKNNNYDIISCLFNWYFICNYNENTIMCKKLKIIIIMGHRTYKTGYPFMDLVNEFFDLKGDFTTLQTVFNFTPIIKTNIQEMDDKYLLELTLAGYSKEDISIDVDKDVLTISSVIKEDEKDANEKYCMRQFKKTSFKKAFEIPKDANMNNIEAEFKDGILKLNIQKLEENARKATKVTIK